MKNRATNQLTRNFNKTEFACKCGCGFVEIDPSLVAQIQRFRDFLWISTGTEIPITVTCGCRCEKHNADVGGTPHSFHMAGMAADIFFSRIPVLAGGRIAYLAVRFGILELGAIGVYPDRKFMHLDIRPQDKNLVNPDLSKAGKFPYCGPVTTWVNENGVYRYNVDFEQEIKEGVRG